MIGQYCKDQGDRRRQLVGCQVRVVQFVEQRVDFVGFVVIIWDVFVKYNWEDQGESFFRYNWIGVSDLGFDLGYIDWFLVFDQSVDQRGFNSVCEEKE